jgi:hypothetical protein
MRSTRPRVAPSLLGAGLALMFGLTLFPATSRGDVITYYDANNNPLNVSSLTFQQLESGDYITINNGFDTKRFDHFVYGTPTASGTGTVALTAAQIQVAGVSSNGTLDPGPGLIFTGSFIAQAGGIQDTNFKYNVTVSGGNYPIHDIGLAIGAFNVPSGGSVQVVESANQLNTSNPVSGVMTLVQNPGSGPTGNTSDLALFTPQTGITVSKDVRITGGTSAATSITDFTQTFSETAVPEPSTMAIAALGTLGFVGYGLRRRKVLVA